MKFTASRLSEGNKIFPAEIHTEPTGITVRIPGLFSGESKYFDYPNIASVDVHAPMIGYSTITFYSGGTKISAHGFTSSEVKQIKQAIEEGKSHAPVSSSESNNYASGANAGTTVINKGPGLFGMIAADAKRIDERQQRMDQEKKENKERILNKAEEIAMLTFGGSKDEIADKLNNLVTIASTKPDKKVKNAIIEKMEFGIMKLRGLGANEEASFFDKKLEPLKKKSWF